MAVVCAGIVVVDTRLAQFSLAWFGLAWPDVVLTFVKHECTRMCDFITFGAARCQEKIV